MEKKQLQKFSRKIAGTVKLPASKSLSNRALLIQALSYSVAPIDNLSDCEDTSYLKQALFSNTNRFYTGDGGTTMRFLTAYLSKIVGEWHIDCSERMKERPVKILVEALNELGAQISYLEKDGYPPLKILGSNLTKSELKLSGSVSSQYISALLMLAPTLQNGLKLNLTGKIVSRPYIEMTLQLMKEFGVSSAFAGNTITVTPQSYNFKPFSIEADWSSASYFYELLCLAEEGELLLAGLRSDSCQGDSQQVALWEHLGIKTIFEDNGVRLLKVNSNTKALEFDFTEMPDLAQTFAVTCCMKGIPFHFMGLETLKIKETNRVEALITELAKLGFVLQEPKESSLEWKGERCEVAQNISIATYRDHRMAMAFAPIATQHPITITIENPQVVRKSFPKFWEELEKFGC